MTCILKSCAHGTYKACTTLAKSGLGECGAAHALELATRNDGYLVHGASNPTIVALVKAGKITTARVDGRYVIARVVHVPKPAYHSVKPILDMDRAVQIGSGINLNEETYA